MFGSTHTRTNCLLQFGSLSQNIVKEKTNEFLTSISDDAHKHIRSYDGQAIFITFYRSEITCVGPRLPISLRFLFPGTLSPPL